MFEHPNQKLQMLEVGPLKINFYLIPRKKETPISHPIKLPEKEGRPKLDCYILLILKHSFLELLFEF